VIVVTLAIAFVVATLLRSPLVEQSHGGKTVDISG